MFWVGVISLIFGDLVIGDALLLFWWDVCVCLLSLFVLIVLLLY